jgi:hypothetical protein
MGVVKGLLQQFVDGNHEEKLHQDWQQQTTPSYEVNKMMKVSKCISLARIDKQTKYQYHQYSEQVTERSEPSRKVPGIRHFDKGAVKLDDKRVVMRPILVKSFQLLLYLQFVFILIIIR